MVDPLIHDAADGSFITKTAIASKADVDAAVAAALQAFKTTWGTKVTAAERAKLMFKLADLVEKNAEELAALEALNAGMFLLSASWALARRCADRVQAEASIKQRDTMSLTLLPICATTEAGQTSTTDRPSRYVSQALSTLREADNGTRLPMVALRTHVMTPSAYACVSIHSQGDCCD